MRVLMSGGTGFIGRYLSEALCRRGDLVTVLTRDEAAARRKLGDKVTAVAWAPDRDDWFRAVESQDAIVHLAGEMAVGQRWTKRKKQEIFDSRVKSTEQLVEAIRRVDPSKRPRVFVCASGVDYYGARSADEVVDESSSPGNAFLSEVTKAWEAAAEKATDLGVRVVRTRFGIVLGRGGGALPQMARPFKMFVGGPIGSGEQYVSWVHIDDLVGIILRCLDDDTIRGPVNVTAPNPVTNAELSSAIGEVLHRPSSMPVPGFALRLLFGEGAEPVLTGRRVMPGVMQRKGYEFRFPDLKPALIAAL